MAYKDWVVVKPNTNHIILALFSVFCIVLLCTGTVCAKVITVSPESGTSTITAAVAKAIDGDTILVKDGTYSENIYIMFHENLIIRSENGAENTTIKASNPSAHVFSVYEDNVTIEGFNITGATAGSMAGIYLSNSPNSTISNNIFTENDRGIYLHTSSNSILTGNKANNNTKYGIYVYSSSNSTLTGNNANNNTDTGIYLVSSGSSTLTGNNANNNSNNVNNNFEYGIYLSSSGNSILTGNNVNNNTDTGICLLSSGNSILTGNNVNGNTDTGILLANSGNTTLTQNIMLANTYNLCINADSLADHVYDIPTNNYVDDKPVYYLLDRSDYIVPSTAGVVYAINSSNITVNGLDISNEYYGIYFYNTKNSTIENTTVSDCYGAFYLSSASNNKVKDNNATNNDYYGIYLLGSGNNTLTDNNATNNDYYGIYLLGSGNNTLTGNNANNNTGPGIFLQSSSNNNLTGNCLNNNDYGMLIYTADYNVLTNNIAVNNTEYDVYTFITGSNNEIDYLSITDNDTQVSFLSDNTNTGIKGTATNSTKLSGKINVNGYFMVTRDTTAINISVSYNDSGMNNAGESTIDLYRYNNSAWETVSDTSLNTSGNLVTASLINGTYGLFGDEDIYSGSGSSSPKVIIVSPELGNSTITAGLANASAGDTILVKNGTYIENVNVTISNITIRSEYGAENTTIKANSSSDYLFNVTADNVTIDGFNVTGATGNQKAGIYLYGNSNCTISNNSLTGNDQGIRLSNSGNNTLTGNNANNNTNSGISLMASSNTICKNNTANNNDYIGILLMQAYDNVLTNNIAVNNTGCEIYTYSAGTNNEINDLIITDNGTQISFLSDDTKTCITGTATNSTTLSGKININGYFTVTRNTTAVAINISVSYNDSLMNDSGESTIGLYRYNNSAWEAVNDASLNTSGNLVTASLINGTFGLFGDEDIYSDSEDSSDSSSGSSSGSSGSSSSSGTRFTVNSAVEDVTATTTFSTDSDDVGTNEQEDTQTPTESNESGNDSDVPVEQNASTGYPHAIFGVCAILGLAIVAVKRQNRKE